MPQGNGAEVVAVSYGEPLQYAPRDRSSYSTLHYMVLAEVIRVAAGGYRTPAMARTALAGGLTAGLLLSAGTGWLLRRFLYGLSPLDPLSYAIVAAILTAAAIGATYVPAGRELRVDPVLTLRVE